MNTITCGLTATSSANLQARATLVLQRVSAIRQSTLELRQQIAALAEDLQDDEETPEGDLKDQLSDQLESLEELIGYLTAELDPAAQCPILRLMAP